MSNEEATGGATGHKQRRVRVGGLIVWCKDLIRRRKATTVLLAFAIGVGLTAMGGLWQTGRVGTGAVERWIGTYLSSVINTSLHPQLTFTQLDYQYPDTVVIRDARIIADDPAFPGQSTEILWVSEMRLELAQIPRVGEPIKIRQLVLRRPEIRLIAVEPNDHRLVGFSDLLREAPEPGPPGTEVKFSDLFHIRLVDLSEGSILYNPRQEDGAMMRLQGITTRLDLTPKDPGEYAFAVELNRQPIFGLSVAGLMNVDDLMVQLESLTLTTRVDRQHDQHLPPMAQAMLRQYQVKGNISVSSQGEIPLMDWPKSTLTSQIDAQHTLFVLGQYKVPIDQLLLQARLDQQALIIDRLEVATLEGRVSAHGSIDLNTDFNSRLSIKTDALRIGQAWNGDPSNPQQQPPPFRGKVTLDAELSGPLRHIMTQAAGRGSVHIREGRLASLPVLSAIADAVSAALNIANFDETQSHLNDRADVEFELRGDHVAFTSIQGSGSGYAYRGEGVIKSDTSLDLRFNGGPMELIQDQLGPVGDMIGAVTDSFTKYTVKGTLAEPIVGVDMLGGFKEAPQNKSSVTEKP